MKRSTWSGGPLAAGLLVAWLAATPAAAQQVQKEKAWELLDGLRERGFHELALDYLDQIQESPRCPDDLKELIDYEAGVTLMVGAGRQGTPEAQQKQLDDARDRFNKFIEDRPDHPLLAKANTQLANVLVVRGELKTRLADQPNKSDTEKKKLVEEAREFYKQARTAFEEAERRVYEKAKALQGVLDPRKDADKITERDQARTDLLEARLYLAGVVYEIGKTYPKDSKEYKENLTQAADQYHKLYENYGSLIGGNFARMQEGRMYKDLGETDKAINVFKEVLTLPDAAEAFRQLKTQSLVLLLETYLLPEVKDYQEAVAKVEAWTENARGAEESSAEGLAIHYLGGLAALAQAESLKPNDPKRKEGITAARRHFDFVARFPGDYQRDARSKLLALSGGSEDEAPEPSDYVEAKDRGDFAWGTMVVALGHSQTAADKQARQKAAEQTNEARDDAIRYYRMFLAMAPPDVSVDDVNLTRFRLTYLYWLAEEYHRAAVLGEFLATRYPQSAGARKGAEIAVKAYRTLFADALRHSRDTSFETRRMSDIAQYITTRWADQPEAQEAWMMLIDTAVDNRDLDAALACLDKIAPDSPQRSQAELRTGQALWAAYVTGSAKEEDERPPQEELDQMAQKAQETLEQGIQRMRQAVDAGEPPSYSLVFSVLSLAHIHLGAGRSEEAVKWLDDPKIGPVTLLKANDPAVRGQEQFAEDTYKAALRAYVGAQKLDEAEATMAALEQLVAAAGDAEANRRLTKIYIQLGRELQEQLTRLRTENKSDEAKRVSEGFEMFLNKISEREEGNNFNSLNWVAETFFGLGAGNPPAEAIGYYTNAARTYAKILERAAAEAGFAPPDADISIKVRLAACLRALGKYESAMKILVAILREREKRLDVQIEAARTYQDWGQERASLYEYAIRGGQEYEGRYLVWGWGGIASRLAPFYDKYESTFHEARYNLAVCRHKLALTRSGAEKTETLQQAKLDILRVYQLYPSMGGPDWFGKYDTLLKNIQKLLKEQPTGLKSE